MYKQMDFFSWNPKLCINKEAIWIFKVDSSFVRSICITGENIIVW